IRTSSPVQGEPSRPQTITGRAEGMLRAPILASGGLREAARHVGRLDRQEREPADSPRRLQLDGIAAAPAVEGLPNRRSDGDPSAGWVGFALSHEEVLEPP